MQERVVSIKVLNLTTQYQLTLLPSRLEASLHKPEGSTLTARQATGRCSAREHPRGSQSGMQTKRNQEENSQALSVGIFRKQLQSSLEEGLKMPAEELAE